MKKIVVLWVGLLCSLSFSQSYHADYKTVNMHSPFRWVVADSTARVALTVTARDTQKLCFQIADTTIWLLSDDSPKRWTWVSGKKIDTLYVSKGIKVTRATIDSSKTRHAVVDSATIPVLKGHTTKRDSTTFTGGIRGVRLSMDSIFNLTGTAGYVQYLSNSKKLINAPIYTNGTNVAIGKSTVAAWEGLYNALQIGGNGAIMARSTEAGNSNVHYITNGYYDGVWKPFADGDFALFVAGTGGFTWKYNSGLTANVWFTPTTVMSLSTTGVLNLPSLTESRAVITDGSKNLMSSAVTSTELALLSGKNSVIDGSGTSGNIPVFTGTGRIGNGPAYNSGTGTITGSISGKADTARAAYKADTSRAAYKADTARAAYKADTARAAGTATNLSGGFVDADSIKLNGGSALTAYITGSFPCTLKTSDVTVQQIGTIRYTVVGDVVHLSLPCLFGTSSSTTLRLYCSVPASAKPTSAEEVEGYAISFNNGQYSPGSNYIYDPDSSYIKFYTGTTLGAYTASGTKAIGTFTSTNNRQTIYWIK